MSEKRKKKRGAAWKAEEDEELNISRAFVERTEYIENAVEDDTHFFIHAELHIKLYTYKGTHFAVPLYMGVARISRREGGGSKLVPTKTVGIKSLHYVRTHYKTLAFTLRKQKTPWLPLSERVYHFLNIYVSVVIDVHQRQPRLSLA